MNVPAEGFDPILDEARRLDEQMLGPAAPEAVSEPAPAPSIPSAELLAPALAFIFKKGAPNWRVTTAETTELAEKLGAVLDKYVPGGALVLLDRWKEEIALLGCGWAIYSARDGVPLFAPTADTGNADGQKSEV